MLVLVVNAGSSSLKSQLIETETGESTMKCLAEKVGLPDGFMNVSFAPDFEKTTYEMPDVTVADCLVKLLEVLGSDPASPVKSLDEIGAIGNRVVHGGEHFSSSVLIDDDVLAKIESCNDLAPLHNPPGLACIYKTRELYPNMPQVAVFDTAFHATMPAKAYMYPIPMEYYKKHAIRRYGFHGTSHGYAARTAAELVGKPVEELGIITCHLGNGGSITAVDGGKSVDTTMGLTPLEGLMMGTRCGDIDPAIIPFLMNKEGLSAAEVDTILNKKSGFLGVSGVSSDMRDVEEAAANGNEDAQLALDMYIYRVQKAIGSYFAILPHTDVIVMTAGVGENSISAREKIFAGLEHLGIKLDAEANNVRGKNTIISAADSSVQICLVAADEEACIANDAAEIVGAL
ncbi:MAG: acetate kinase [Eggerthellaceae bacterium]|nr:acetate kinase [Eggerthellaceae bacterium]